MQINIKVLSNRQALQTLLFLEQEIGLERLHDVFRDVLDEEGGVVDKELVGQEGTHKDSVFTDDNLTDEQKGRIKQYQEDNQLPETFYREVE